MRMPMLCSYTSVASYNFTFVTIQLTYVAIGT